MIGRLASSGALLLASVVLAGCGSEAGVAGVSVSVQEAMQDDLPSDLAKGRTPVEIKTANCLLWPSNFRGTCGFEPRGRGSFSVTLEEEDGVFFDDVSQILVSVFLPGQADVRAITTGGTSFMMGEARRSEEYPACWIGEGFSVCAY
jgi:hypothetical protein